MGREHYGSAAGSALCAPGRSGAHGNPETSVVDEFGRTHDICNLFACDDSVMPTQGSANPVLPIMALAARIADYLVTQGNEIFSSRKRNREKPAVRRNLPPPGTKPHSLPVI